MCIRNGSNGENEINYLDFYNSVAKVPRVRLCVFHDNTNQSNECSIRSHRRLVGGHVE